MKLFRSWFLHDLSVMYILLACLICVTDAKAEGSHPNPASQGGGVDRMVYTPSIDTNGSAIGGYLGALANVQLGASIPTYNPWQDNQAFYLGGWQPTTNVMMDTGINYDLVSGKYKIFMGMNGQYILVRQWLPTANGVPGHWAPLTIPSSQNQYTLNFNIDPATGNASLNVSGVGTIYWSTQAVPVGTPPALPSGGVIPPPSNPDQTQLWPDVSVATPIFNVNGSNYSSIAVKRVVALNRKGAATNGHANPNGDPAYDDGAYMYAAVSSCEYNWKKPDGTWSTNFWLPAQVDQAKTGFDSEPNGGHGASSPYDMIDALGNKTVDSHYVVNFPQTSCGYGTAANNSDNERVARMDVAASWNGQVIGNPISRYTQEYVEIWVRRGTFPTTRLVARRKPH